MEALLRVVRATAGFHAAEAPEGVRALHEEAARAPAQARARHPRAGQRLGSVPRRRRRVGLRSGTGLLLGLLLRRDLDLLAHLGRRVLGRLALLGDLDLEVVPQIFLGLGLDLDVAALQVEQPVLEQAVALRELARRQLLRARAGKEAHRHLAPAVSAVGRAR